jgi:hypothetical protein
VKCPSCIDSMLLLKSITTGNILWQLPRQLTQHRVIFNVKTFASSLKLTHLFTFSSQRKRPFTLLTSQSTVFIWRISLIVPHQKH